MVSSTVGGMMELIDELRLFAAGYPAWVVWSVVAALLLGVTWVAWRIVKFSMIFIVTGLLLSIVGFAGYVIFTS